MSTTCSQAHVQLNQNSENSLFISRTQVQLKQNSENSLFITRTDSTNTKQQQTHNWKAKQQLSKMYSIMYYRGYLSEALSSALIKTQ